MNTIDIKYIDEKLAEARYSYSRKWFQRSRWKGDGPPYLKIKHKILYPIKETDAWFAKHTLRRSTSSRTNNHD